MKTQTNPSSIVSQRKISPLLSSASKTDSKEHLNQQQGSGRAMVDDYDPVNGIGHYYGDKYRGDEALARMRQGDEIYDDRFDNEEYQPYDYFI